MACQWHSWAQVSWWAHATSLCLMLCMARWLSVNIQQSSSLDVSFARKYFCHYIYICNMILIVSCDLIKHLTNLEVTEVQPFPRTISGLTCKDLNQALQPSPPHTWVSLVSLNRFIFDSKVVSINQYYLIIKSKKYVYHIMILRKRFFI